MHPEKAQKVLRRLGHLSTDGRGSEEHDAKLALADAAGELARDDVDGDAEIEHAIEHALEILAGDDAVDVRAHASTALARALEALSPFERTRVVTEWASHRDPRRRATVARALRDPIPILGALSALRALSRDTYVEVREPAFEAIACRLAEAPEIFCRSLARGAADSYASVQQVCVMGLQKAAELGIVPAFDTLATIADRDDPTLGSRACDALAAAASADPQLAAAELERIATHPEDHDPEVLDHIVWDAVAVGGGLGRRRAIEVLGHLTDHPEPWLRREAQEAIAILSLRRDSPVGD